MIYRSVKGSHLTDEQAQRYGERIGALIEQNNGQVDRQSILEDARKKRSPLHDFFEWDDAEAANQYRLDQARYLLRNILVVVKIDDEQEEEVRAFHSVVVTADGSDEAHERAYVQIDRVLTESELKEQVIDQALKALISWKKKYQQYKELAVVVKAIDVLQGAMG